MVARIFCPTLAVWSLSWSLIRLSVVSRVLSSFVDVPESLGCALVQVGAMSSRGCPNEWRNPDREEEM
jgi:hypothetical protein